MATEGPDRWLPVQNPAYYLLGDYAPVLRGRNFFLDLKAILELEYRQMTPVIILQNIILGGALRPKKNGLFGHARRGRE